MEEKITTSDIAKQLNTSNNVILNAVKKCLPEKIIENGKKTYFNKEETATILNYLKKSSNRTDLTTYKTSLIATSINNNDNDFIGIIKQLLNENRTLINYKQEQITKENETFKNKLLKNKIIKYIKKVAKVEFNNDYKQASDYFFNLYTSKYKLRFTQDLNTIEDRGHLNEFYLLIINN